MYYTLDTIDFCIGGSDKKAGDIRDKASSVWTLDKLAVSASITPDTGGFNGGNMVSPV